MKLWSNKSLATPIYNIRRRSEAMAGQVARRRKDGVPSARPETFRGSASRVYSPVEPRTLTGFTLIGPVHPSAVPLRRTGVAGRSDCDHFQVKFYLAIFIGICSDCFPT